MFAAAIAPDSFPTTRVLKTFPDGTVWWLMDECAGTPLSVRPTAERATAHPGPEGSDSWIEAQQAISRVEAARARTDDAAAELHRLRLTHTQQPTSAADLAAIDAAIAEVGALVENQQRRMDRINRP